MLSLNMKNNRKQYKREWYAKTIAKRRELSAIYREKNREKLNERARVRYHSHREEELDRIRMRKYGISGEMFRELTKKQKGKCPICSRLLLKNPSVDHDHNSGKIRGLICNKCNLSIGNAGDSPKILRALADYLENKNYGI